MSKKMRLGNVLASLSALAVVFWRIVVVATNCVWSAYHRRWIDASYWAAEDPLEKVEAAVFRILGFQSLDPMGATYAFQAIGTLVWAGVAFAFFMLFKRLSIVHRFNVVTVKLRVLLALSGLMVMGAYVGVLLRQTPVSSIRESIPWLLESVIMMMTVVFSGMLPVVFASWVVFRRCRTE